MICRPATADDMDFIVETFCKTFRAASTHAEGVPKERMPRLILNLLANGWTATICEADGMIIGWLVSGVKNRLAWMYVRDLFRGQGVAKFMLKHAGIDTGKTFVSPFLPNRLARRCRIDLRPFECLV
jgi:GNAT superfamily N-acetyltransferase